MSDVWTGIGEKSGALMCVCVCEFIWYKKKNNRISMNKSIWTCIHTRVRSIIRKYTTNSNPPSKKSLRAREREKHRDIGQFIFNIICFLWLFSSSGSSGSNSIILSLFFKMVSWCVAVSVLFCFVFCVPKWCQKPFYWNTQPRFLSFLFCFNICRELNDFSIRFYFCFRRIGFGVVNITYTYYDMFLWKIFDTSRCIFSHTFIVRM